LGKVPRLGVNTSLKGNANLHNRKYKFTKETLWGGGRCFQKPNSIGRGGKGITSRIRCKDEGSAKHTENPHLVQKAKKGLWKKRT